jgi:hypothetical protein
MRNSNRNVDLLALGAAGILGFLAIKALTTPSSASRSATRPRALPAPRREFLPLYSVHGAAYGFGTPGNEMPVAPFKTFDEAAQDARRFDTTADAIEGRACVMDVRTGQRFSPYPAAAQQ